MNADRARSGDDLSHSYYYEPVTSYRYSSYYDSCSCSYTQVAVPQTSYQAQGAKQPGAELGVALRAGAGARLSEGRLLAAADDLLHTRLKAPRLHAAAAGESDPQSPPAGEPRASPGRSHRARAARRCGTSIIRRWKSPRSRRRRTHVVAAAARGPEAIKVNEPQPKPAPSTVKLDRIAVGANSVVEGQVARAATTARSERQGPVRQRLTSEKQNDLHQHRGRFQTQLPPAAGTSTSRAGRLARLPQPHRRERRSVPSGEPGEPQQLIGMDSHLLGSPIHRESGFFTIRFNFVEVLVPS